MLIKWRDNTGFPALSSMFDDFFNNDLTSFFGRDMSEFFNRNQSLVMPAVNIKETPDAFQIEVAAPGLRKEDFKLNLDHNILTISAQRETRSGYEQPQSESQTNEQGATAVTEGQTGEQTNTNNQDAHQNAGGTPSSGEQSPAMPGGSQNKPQRYTRREFSYTSFQRSFTLPETVEAEQISANYQDGILTINVPKQPQKPANNKRTIDIS